MRYTCRIANTAWMWREAGSEKLMREARSEAGTANTFLWTTIKITNSEQLGCIFFLMLKSLNSGVEVSMEMQTSIHMR